MNMLPVRRFIMFACSHLIDRIVLGLQERRERRSSKKAILNPKPPPGPYYDPPASGSVSGSSSLSQRQTHSRKEKRSPKRQKHHPQRDKGKAIKKKSGRSGPCSRASAASTPQQLPPKRKRINQISAGLSLMHNFDARNIVRSRITVRWRLRQHDQFQFSPLPVKTATQTRSL